MMAQHLFFAQVLLKKSLQKYHNPVFQEYLQNQRNVGRALNLTKSKRSQWRDQPKSLAWAENVGGKCLTTGI